MNPEQRTVDEVDAKVRKRAVAYVTLFAILGLAYFLVKGSPWQGSSQLHTVMETIAAVLALFASVLALVRFYTKKTNLFLFVGTGFLVTGLLEGYHAIATSSFFAGRFASPYSALIAWSGFVPRVFLSVHLWLGSFLWRREARLGARGLLSDHMIHSVGGLLMLATSFFLPKVLLPPGYHPQLLLPRPQDLVPAAFCLLAFVGYLRKGNWKRDAFEHWLLLSLLVGFVSQAPFLSSSRQVFDAFYNAAHVLKVLSYVFVLTGLVINMYGLFIQLARSQEVLRDQELQNKIAERRQAEAALRTSEALYHSLVESLPQNVFRKDLEGRFTFGNQRFCATLGKRLDEVVGKTDFDFFPAELAEKYQQDDRRVTQTGAMFEDIEAHQPPGGQRLYVQVVKTPIHDPEGKIVGTQGIFWDVTERKRAEAALRESEERYRTVAETASDAIITMDEQSTILFVNTAAQDIFGYTAEELLGQKLTLLMPEALRQDHRAGMMRYMETGKRQIRGKGVELPGRHKSGREIPLEISFGEFIKDGRRFFTGILRDITDRREAQEALRQSEERLRQSQKMEAIGQLAGGVAHDFNNLLTAIIGYAQLLMHNLEDGALRNHIEQIKKAGERAADLTRQLLAFSRKQVLQPRMLDLNVVVKNMENLLRRLIGEDIDLVVAPDPALARVKADPGQVELVIMNLAVNARDALPAGGKLTIETANIYLDEAYARERPSVLAGPHVMLAVSDNGCGMDAETRSHLFEPFFTTKEQGKGTGLGLATVYGIVNQSGGHIWVYSEPGQGTTFRIYLPRIAEAVPEFGPTVRQERPVHGSETVLLVEDEEVVRALAREVLERSGYKVLEASGGSEALEICEQHRGPIHLILTDVVMPGMNGRELVNRLAPRRPEMRVLYMSGYTGNAIVHHGVLDGGMAFLQKPFEPDTLARKVRAVLDAPQYTT